MQHGHTTDEDMYYLQLGLYLDERQTLIEKIVTRDSVKVAFNCQVRIVPFQSLAAFADKIDYKSIKIFNNKAKTNSKNRAMPNFVKKFWLQAKDMMAPGETIR